MNTRDHWNTVYTVKQDQQLSWFEMFPTVSVDMIEAAGLASDMCVLDVGGGDSRLVDYLIGRGLHCVAVLDVLSAALMRARTRLGAIAKSVTWIESDVTGDWSFTPVDIWHDRAVFHFLNDPAARVEYRAHLMRILKPHGSAIIATFALDGPATCSGLPVSRYSPETLAIEMGAGLRLVESIRHVHSTPWGAVQPFQYSRFVRNE